jgi:ketosteroid isomerase-like protein
MSQENVNIIRGMYEAFAKGDVPTIEEVLDAGDTAIGHGYYSGTYRKNGERVRAQFAHFFTFRDGKVVKFQQYTDTAQFLQAVNK